jgi:hypothetical protein
LAVAAAVLAAVAAAADGLADLAVPVAAVAAAADAKVVLAAGIAAAAVVAAAVSEDANFIRYSGIEISGTKSSVIRYFTAEDFVLFLI